MHLSLRDAVVSQLCSFLTPPSFENLRCPFFGKKVQKCRSRQNLTKKMPKSVRKMPIFAIKCWKFSDKFYPKSTFYVHLYCKKSLYNIPNLQHNFWTWVWPPPPVWTMLTLYSAGGLNQPPPLLVFCSSMKKNNGKSCQFFFTFHRYRNGRLGTMYFLRSDIIWGG